MDARGEARGDRGRPHSKWADEGGARAEKTAGRIFFNDILSIKGCDAVDRRRGCEVDAHRGQGGGASVVRRRKSEEYTPKRARRCDNVYVAKEWDERAPPPLDEGLEPPSAWKTFNTAPRPIS